MIQTLEKLFPHPHAFTQIKLPESHFLPRLHNKRYNSAHRIAATEFTKTKKLDIKGERITGKKIFAKRSCVVWGDIKQTSSNWFDTNETMDLDKNEEY